MLLPLTGQCFGRASQMLTPLYFSCVGRSTLTSRSYIIPARSQKLWTGTVIKFEPPLSVCGIHRRNIATTSTYSTSRKDGISVQSLPARFPGFTTVYRNPYINHIRLFTRMKVYETVLAAFLVPVSLSYLAAGQLAPSTVGLITGFFVSTTVLMMVFGEFFRKFIGIIYVSEKKDQVIFSHLSFFGGRKDVVIDIGDIETLSTTMENTTDIYWKININNSKEFFYISTKYGGIVDRKNFEHIFGAD